MRAVTRAIVQAQGVAGVVSIAAGAYLLAGLGVALLLAGVALLVGAWSSR
jgi:predicted phage tail protein